MSTIGPNVNDTEWLNNGTAVDLDAGKGSYPDFLTPAPELVVEVPI